MRRLETPEASGDRPASAIMDSTFRCQAGCNLVTDWLWPASHNHIRRKSNGIVKDSERRPQPMVIRNLVAVNRL
jgi:hypothetical protein